MPLPRHGLFFLKLQLGAFDCDGVVSAFWLCPGRCGERAAPVSLNYKDNAGMLSSSFDRGQSLHNDVSDLFHGGIDRLWLGYFDHTQQSQLLRQQAWLHREPEF